MRLSHSPADVLRWLLIDLGAGTDPADAGSWPVQESNEPSLPDNLIVLYDTAGEIRYRDHHTGRALEHYGVQITVRGTSKTVTWAKMDEVVHKLEEHVTNTIVTVGSSQYTVYAVTRRSGPMALGREPATNRLLFSLNVVAAINQLS